MLYQFAPDKNGKAVPVVSNFNGFLVVFSVAPFWLSNVRNFETISGAPAPGSNVESREGIYIVPPATGIVDPISWHGDAYILNGTGVLDNPNNMVVVLPQSLC